MANIKSWKFIKIFLVGVFLSGIISSALCFTGLKNTPSSCHSKNHQADKNAENCLTHCAKQKVFVVKAENYSLEDLGIKEARVTKIGYLEASPVYQLKLYPTREFCLKRGISKLPIVQIYLTAFSVRAPPVYL